MADRLADGVWLLDLDRVPVFGANAFLVDDGEVTLVDAGLPRAGLGDELAAAGYAPADVDRVLLTHYDLDHVGGLGDLALDAPAYAGARDAALATGAYDPPWLHHKGAFHRLARRLWSLPADLELRSVDDGQRVGAFTVYHTPGHNPGHVAYVHDGLDVGLLGDLVWEVDGDLTPPEWWDSYDVARLHESIRTFAGAAPSLSVLCPGHGDPIVGGGSARLTDLATRLA
ncbi:MBL fold metallo-hydrolase [Halomicrococcus gelatinilyticus]|uniref:MBL fold metallo-hydrolase n=1 Tax=Halomicrococcus gelatinilyticus TaxID=1702103 RepID=UPI002E0D1612